MTDSVQQHRDESPHSLSFAVLTVSDTRTEEDDRSGQLILSMLDQSGHRVCDYRILPDEPIDIAAQLRQWSQREDVDVIVLNGGTGISPRDRTFEAVATVLDRSLDGFGELFRMLSWEEIGAAAMLSRASAGIVNNIPVFSVPGSSKAVRLAMEQLILPEAGHVVFECRKV